MGPLCNFHIGVENRLDYRPLILLLGDLWSTFFYSIIDCVANFIADSTFYCVLFALIWPKRERERIRGTKGRKMFCVFTGCSCTLLIRLRLPFLHFHHKYAVFLRNTPMKAACWQCCQVILSLLLLCLSSSDSADEAATAQRSLCNSSWQKN